MIEPLRLHLTPADLADVRIATSAVVEAAAAIFITRQGGPFDELDDAMIAHLRRTTQGRDLRLLDALNEPGRYVPDFLAKLAPGGADLGRELGYLRALPEQQVHHHLEFAYPDGLPGDLGPFEHGARRGLAATADALEDVGRLTIAPVWERARAIVEGDLLVRARQLAVEGPEAVLRDLHPSMQYADGTLTFAPPGLFGGDVQLEGRGLWLVPCAFLGTHRLVGVDPSDRVTIAYGPRGAAALWHQTRTPDADALVALLGASRSQLLRQLRTPSTTQGLAAILRVTPSAISQQLRILDDAGLVEAARIGRFVHYRLSEEGQAVVALLERQCSSALRAG